MYLNTPYYQVPMLPQPPNSFLYLFLSSIPHGYPTASAGQYEVPISLRLLLSCPKWGMHLAMPLAAVSTDPDLLDLLPEEETLTPCSPLRI